MEMLSSPAELSISVASHLAAQACAHRAGQWRAELAARNPHTANVGEYDTCDLVRSLPSNDLWHCPTSPEAVSRQGLVRTRDQRATRKMLALLGWESVPN